MVNPETGKLEGFEFFAGRQGWSYGFRKRGHSVYSTDIEDFEGIDLVQDFLETTPEDFLKVYDGRRPDFVCASPPCEAFSIAGIWFHWRREEVWTPGKSDPEIVWTPISETADLGIKLIEHLLYIIEQLNPRFFWIENPRGGLRKMPQMQHLPRETVTYCSYGDHRMKPTDLWGRFPDSWQPRPMARPGRGKKYVMGEDGHRWVLGMDGKPSHHYAPRGYKKGGTQGTKGYWNRSHIPEELSDEVAESATNPEDHREWL